MFRNVFFIFFQISASDDDDKEKEKNTPHLCRWFAREKVNSIMRYLVNVKYLYIKQQNLNKLHIFIFTHFLKTLYKDEGHFEDYATFFL